MLLYNTVVIGILSCDPQKAPKIKETTTNKIIDNFTSLLQNDIKDNTIKGSLSFVIIHREDQNLIEMLMQILFFFHWVYFKYSK